MTEDNTPRVSTSESADASATKQRKRRKWDQPAEVVVSGIPQLLNVASMSGTALPGIAALSGAYYSNPRTATVPTLLPTIPTLLPQQQAVAISQKLNQIQDEVIAREIVINDADSNVRYKLTKRNTQEEILRVTGAIVITRGKFIPLNAPPAGEKPLYLHISAGSHLETMAERIKAIDRAAAMVEDMLKHGSSGTEVNGNHNLNACVYLGFETDPSLNIPARIRGPNDQYVNHIMNETGVTVSLRGQCSGNSERASAEEGQYPLHLFLSSNNLKSLERAKLLAENLLDTISAECSAKRFSSSKVYGAVPPPPQLLAEVKSSMDDSSVHMQPASNLMASALGCNVSPVSATSIIASSRMVPHVHSVSGQSTANAGYYSHGTLSQGTSYDGYGGIYPHASPLQQVASALRHSISPATTLMAPTVTTAHTSYASTSYSLEKEMRSSQKRKFKESPAVEKGDVNLKQTLLQVSEHAKPCELTSDVGTNNDKSLMRPSTNGILPNPTKVMLPLPPKFAALSPSVHRTPSVNPLHPNPKVMPPPPKFTPSSAGVFSNTSANGLLPNHEVMPPPPPKFSELSSGVQGNGQSLHKKSISKSVPDTLIKLMEYGDDDDDDEEDGDELGEPSKSSNSCMATKPFWSV